MERIPVFDAQQLTAISKILADTEKGMTGSEIGYLLQSCKIAGQNDERRGRMKPGATNLTSEDVLNAFAVEPQHDRSTLERYLRKYPQYALELAQLSHEFSTGMEERKALTKDDASAIEEAWRQYSSSTAGSVAKIFENLSVPQLRDLSKYLDVPRQILTAFRERKVIVSSIPQ